MDIAILLFDGITALDAVGPYEVLSRLPDARVRFVGAERGPVRTDNGMLALVIDEDLSTVSNPEIVLVPGGWGSAAAMTDAEILGWLREAHQSSRWTCSVCTGSLILAAAGLLHGVHATTHWRSMSQLGSLGAIATAERIVLDGKIITAAGVSAGIDMALRLAAILAGEELACAIQLSIEYDPDPPFQSGSPTKAAPAIVELVKQGGLRRGRTSTTVASSAGSPRGGGV